MGCTIKSYNYEKLKDNGAIMYFTQISGSKKVAKITYDSNSYEYSVSQNIDLKYVKELPIENHFIKNEKSYIIYPYIASDLVNWSQYNTNNNAMERYSSMAENSKKWFEIEYNI